MKKHLIALCVSSLISGSAMALEKGDRMPNIDGIRVIHHDFWESRNGRQSGIYLHADKELDGNADYGVAIVSCDGKLMDRAFAIYDEAAGKLYFDKDADRIMGGVVKGRNVIDETEIEENAPTCSEYKKILSPGI